MTDRPIPLEEDRPIPERQWLVSGLIPLGSVTMLSGDGGLRKSILGLQLIAWMMEATE